MSKKEHSVLDDGLTVSGLSAQASSESGALVSENLVTNLPEPGDTADLSEVAEALAQDAALAQQSDVVEQASEGALAAAQPLADQLDVAGQIAPAAAQGENNATAKQATAALAPEASLTETPTPPRDGEVAEPVNAPGLETVPVEGRTGADTSTGKNRTLAWGARTDVGLIREHNEDSFLVQAPLFAVCDGMGGHAAGEVASSLAVQSIGREAPEHAEDALLGTAIETANAEIMSAVTRGIGKPGMGCTATAVLIEEDKMAVAHVGDSRVYVLHNGTLVRITHDHSFVEELVDAGEITADEARVHPSRSVITRALGSDPEMYADHFTLDVEKGDRIIICSDGLSSMSSDSLIESVAVSAASPQQAADNLVSCALSEGGHDNVTVVVVDVLSDGRAEKRRKHILHQLGVWAAILVVFTVFLAGAAALFINNSYYIANNNGTVAIYQGVEGELFGNALSHIDDETSIQVSDLPEATQKLLDEGIRVASYNDAVNVVEGYRAQIDEQKQQAAQTSETTQGQAEHDENGNPVTTEALATPEEASEDPADAPEAAANASSEEEGGE